MNTTTKSDHDKKTDAKMCTMPTGVTTKTEVCANTHDGKVISVSGNKLTMSCHEGKEHSHTVATDAKVTCDGAVCKTEDLKPGAKIRVTTTPDDKKVATKIESLQKHPEFAKSC